MSFNTINTDSISPSHSARVSHKSALIDAGTLTSCLLSSGTIANPVITSGTLTSCILSGGSITNSTITGATCRNISSLTMATSTGSFTVTGNGDSTGGAANLEVAYDYWIINDMAHVRLNGLAGFGLGSGLTVSGVASIIRPLGDIHIPVHIIDGSTGAWGDFVVHSDGTANIYATANSGNFTNGNELHVSNMYLSWVRPIIL